MRKLLLLFGSLLLIYASLRILLDTVFRSDLRLERILCRYLLLCSDDVLLEKAQEQLTREDDGSLKQSVANFQEALRRNPASASRWCDLGEALLESGQTEKARACFSGALDLSVESTPILWRAAQFYFRIQEEKAALRCMNRILLKGPDYDSAVFEMYLHSSVPILETLNYGIPQGRAGQSYFRYLLRFGEVPDDVAVAWNWIASRSLADDRLAGEYVDFLVKGQKYEQAIEAWIRYLGDRRGAYQESDFLYNGDFEFEPSGSSFDWRVRSLEGVEVTRDSGVSCSGSFSLRIRFEGKENLSYSHISQVAVVKPGTYLFRAQVRTEGITTDQGIGFRISDAESSAHLNIRTENLVGTTGWKKVEATFLVPPQTKLIQLQVVRQPSWKFDNKISGTVWIDGVSLISERTEKEGPTRH